MINLLEHTRRPDVTFRRSGRIAISTRVARRLSLSPGDVIGICAEGGEFLLHVRLRSPEGSHEAKCFPACRSRPAGHMLCHSPRLARSLLDAAGIADAPVARFPCGYPLDIDGETYIPILTRLPIT